MAYSVGRRRKWKGAGCQRGGKRMRRRFRRGSRVGSRMPFRASVLRYGRSGTGPRAVSVFGKYWDTATMGTPIYTLGQSMNSTGSIFLIDNIPLGSGVNAREGRSWRVDSVEVRGNVQSDSATPVSVVRWHIVWDKQPNGVMPAVNDIFDTGSSTSLIRRDNSSRFVVVATNAYSLCGSNTTVTTDAAGFVVDKKVFLKNAVALCNTTGANTGVIGERVSGACFLVLTGDKPSGTSDGTFTCNIRVNFTDIMG